VNAQTEVLNMQYSQHPLSAAFPAMHADEFQSLKDSIENIGVQNPITLFEGMVIDGWHRYSAATELGMDCPRKELDAWIDPVAFVRAQNKDRRHLPLSAWALIEVSLREWKPSHRPDKGELSSPLQASNQEMADAVGVTKRTIQQAKAVQSNATPEVIAAVKSGEIGLPKAAAIAKLPKEEQAAAIHKPTPKAAPVEEAPAYDGPDEAEIRAAELQEQADQDAFNKLLLADDKLATAYNEIKRLNAVNAVLESRLQGLMNEKAEAIRLVKSRDRQIAKLEAMLKEAA
jgi:hypothetical protein